MARTSDRMATASTSTIGRETVRNGVPKAHPFLPRRLQSPKILVWLRRSHGWLGIWGALAGILFGVTTVLMVHSEVFPARDAEQVIIQLPVNGEVIGSADELGSFAKSELNLLTNWRTPRGRGGGAASARASTDGAAGGGGMVGTRVSQPVFVAQFSSPARTLDLRYIAGNEYIEITRTERGFIDTINRPHRGNGAQLGWTLLGDAFSGALIVLALSGVLLWSRMDGSRLLAIGLGGAGLLSALYFGLAGA